MVTEQGPLKIVEANENAVPVFISICPENGVWVLKASCLHLNLGNMVGEFQPRTYKVTADTKDELVELMNKHVIPFYKDGEQRFEALINRRVVSGQISRSGNMKMFMWNPSIRDKELVIPSTQESRKAVDDMLRKKGLTRNYYRLRPRRVSRKYPRD